MHVVSGLGHKDFWWHLTRTWSRWCSPTSMWDVDVPLFSQPVIPLRGSYPWELKVYTNIQNYFFDRLNRKRLVIRLHWGIIDKWKLYILCQAGLWFLTEPTDNSHNNGNSACRFKKMMTQPHSDRNNTTKMLPVCSAWVTPKPDTKWWGAALYI